MLLGSPSPAKQRPCLPTSPTHMQAMRHATHQKHGGNNNNNNQQNHPGGSGVQNNQNGILLGNGQHNGAILPTIQLGFDFGAELAGFCSPGKIFYFFSFFYV